MVSGSDDNRVLVWDKNSKQLLQELKGHEGKVINSLLFIHLITHYIMLVVLTIHIEIELKLLDHGSGYTESKAVITMILLKNTSSCLLKKCCYNCSLSSVSTGKCCKNAERGAYFNSFP